MSVYRALLARPSARILAAACALGWISFASLAFAITLTVRHSTGSFGNAGIVVGAFAVAAALLAPLRGGLVDRHGGLALILLGAGYMVALLALAVIAQRQASLTALACTAAAAGALGPPLIAVARALWPRVAGPDLSRAAHALNAALGDAGGVLGPVITAGLATWLGPATALAALCLGVFAGCVLVGLLGVPRNNELTAPHTGDVLRASPGLRTLVGAGIWLGLALGAMDVIAPAMAARAGRAEVGAAPLAVFAVGSMISSVWVGRSRRAATADGRFVLGFCVMAVTLIGAIGTRSVPALTAVFGVAGVGYGVLNVGIFELLDEVVEARQAVEALTWLTTAEVLGIAAGAAAAGALVQVSVGAGIVFLGTAAAPGALVAILSRHNLASRNRQQLAG